MRLTSLLTLTCLLQCAGAQPRIGVPALGYAYDASLRAIRAVRGAPGAALLDNTIDAGFALSAAAIAPSQDFALATPADGPGVRIIRWDNGISGTAILEGSVDNPDRFIFSPSGAAAILYESRSGRGQVVSGLPDSPAIRDLPPVDASAIMAVSDDATVIQATAVGACAIGPAGSGPLSVPAPVATLSFRRSSLDLLLVTPAGDLYYLPQLGGNGDIRRIAGGISNPVAIRFSADGDTAIAAAADGSLTAIELSSGNATSLACRCSPTTLEPFGRTDLFRLTDIAGGPLLLFEAGPNSRLWFVPAGNGRSAQ
jgi:hypothetical protein